MARPLRIEFSGAIYHIASGGNARLPIVEDDDDRILLLDILRETTPPWNDLKDQCILGTREFIEKLSPDLKDKCDLPEIPRRERLVFRPSLEELFSESIREHKGKRNEAIRAAHLEYGYGLSEIGNQLSLHYTTISRIITPNS